jgi:hypothetical protein
VLLSWKLFLLENSYKIGKQQQQQQIQPLSPDPMKSKEEEYTECPTQNRPDEIMRKD